MTRKPSPETELVRAFAKVTRARKALGEACAAIARRAEKDEARLDKLNAELDGYTSRLEELQEEALVRDAIEPDPGCDDDGNPIVRDTRTSGPPDSLVS